MKMVGIALLGIKQHWNVICIYHALLKSLSGAADFQTSESSSFSIKKNALL